MFLFGISWGVIGSQEGNSIVEEFPGVLLELESSHGSFFVPIVFLKIFQQVDCINIDPNVFIEIEYFEDFTEQFILFFHESASDFSKLFFILLQGEWNRNELKQAAKWLVVIEDKSYEFFYEKNGKVAEVDGFVDELDHGLENFQLLRDFVEELVKLVVFYQC